MADINVSYSEMKDTAAKLRAGKDDMESKLAELGAQVQNLISSGFQTDLSSHSYGDTFHQFQTGTKQAIDALDGLASFLEQAADAMQNTDTQLSNSIKG